uniref:Uncharacterized protein n=1 Tax=Panagrolaimus davidi TaxID=227884 RepID=A0A914P6X7_9BILA
MKSAIFVVFVALIASSMALKCQKWSKEGGHAVVLGNNIDCSGVCVMGIVNKGHDLYYEGDCSSDKTKKECHNYVEDGNQAFACACDTNECNNYPELLKRGNENKAGAHLGASLPILTGNSASSLSLFGSVFVFAIAAFFGLVL